MFSPSRAASTAVVPSGAITGTRSGRPGRSDGALGARRARHLRLPADGELCLSPVTGLQPHQPARPPPARRHVHRVHGQDGAGARGRPDRGVRRAAPAVPRPPRRRAGGRRRPTRPGPRVPGGGRGADARVPPLSDVVVVLALGGMLAVAFRHPRGRVEAAVGAVCAAATLATGLLTLDQAHAEIDRLAPVVAFLVTILVVSDVCARAGVFAAAADRVGRWSGGSAVRLFTACSCSPPSSPPLSAWTRPWCC